MAENLGGDVGDDACVYRNTGTDTTPVWALIEGIIDDNISDVWGEADVSSRASEFTLVRKNRRTLAVTMSMGHDKDDVDYMALRAAHFSKDHGHPVPIPPGPDQRRRLEGNQGLVPGLLA